MAKYVTIICFLLILGLTAYIYLNFESVNFISEPIQISTNANNRVISGSGISNQVRIDNNFWFTTESNTRGSSSEMQWTDGYKKDDVKRLHNLDITKLNDIYLKQPYQNNKHVEVQKTSGSLKSSELSISFDEYPALPTQSWVQNNILHVLKYLKLVPPIHTSWWRADYLTLLKTYFSPKSDVIYTGIPKSGCTNWKFTILKIEGLFSGDEPSPKVHYIINRLNLANSVYEYPHNYLNKKYVFTVIRNPWTRMVSGYNDKFGSNRMQRWQKGKVALQILQRHRDPNISINDVLHRGVLPTFYEFLRHLAYDPINEINAHFRPQYSMLDLSSVVFNFVGALEHARQQSKDIIIHFKTSGSDNISVPGSYDSSSDPRTERSTLSAKVLLKEVSKDLLDRLYTKYRPDFMIYNYSNFTDPLFPFPLYNTTNPVVL